MKTTEERPRSLFANARYLDRCPCCDSTAIGHFRTGVDYHYQIPGEFDSFRCQSCDVVFMNPMPSADDLASVYPEDYYSYKIPSLPGWLKKTVKRCIGLGRETRLPEFTQPGKMLDVGCGAGQYLLEMKAAGWEALGAELSKSAAAAGREAGLEIRSGELTKAEFDAATFDFVRLNHSFEHIPDPHPVLAEIRRVLKPDGKLFIGVPNADGFNARVFGRYWWYVGLPVHTYCYNPRSLRLLLERNGFAVEGTYYHSDYGGTLGSLQILLNRRRIPRSSDGWLVRSRLLRLPGQYLARLLDVFSQGDCIEVIAVAGGTRQ
jgi:SAM-dependent methyltransferase